MCNNLISHEAKMPPNQMAPIPPPSPANFSGDDRKLDIESVRKLIAIINHHMQGILEDDHSKRALKQKCLSKLKIQSQEFFEFSEHSVISNLYWGIDNTESSSIDQSECDEETESRLESSEKMLQIPASLDENGATLGIPNSYLVCCSYFYLAIVEFLRQNEWQVAMHFLQAVSISPKLVYTEFSPGICHSLFPFFISHKPSSVDFGPLDRVDDPMVDDVMRWIARRYKPWLMYYQIMSTTHFCAVNRVQRSRSVVCKSSYEQRNGLRTYSNPEKMHYPTFQEIIGNDVEEVSINSCTQMSEKHKKIATKGSNIKCLKDILTESEPDTPTSSHSEQNFSKSFIDHEAQVLDHYASLSRNPRSFSSKTRLTQREENKCISRSFSTSYYDTPLVQLDHQYSLIETIVSKLCFTEEISNGDGDYTVEMKTIYEILNTKSGLKYSLLKDMILDQLLTAISSSKEERVLRTSVTILSTIITANRSVVDDIKQKGLELYDLATALKRHVHEAVILIYLISPSPEEIKTLELLPCLLEVVCNSKSYSTSLLVTPKAASLMIIEVLVSAFDYETNGMHLASISSPRMLSGLLQVFKKNNLDELVSLASILVKCMRFDGKCRKYIADFSPVSPLVSLLSSNQKRATYVGLDFFNELLRMPRRSAIDLLEKIRKQGSIDNMCALFLLTQNSEPEYKLLAANLLLQLELLEDASSKTMYKEEALEALLNSLTCEDDPHTQSLSSFILSNLGGTHSWTGEPYTMAWLVKKTGLTLAHHRNLIKTYDFLDQCLQDGGVDSWSSKTAQWILLFRTRVFRALDKGLKSKSRRVSRECLIATAWLGVELVKGSDEVRNAACEILLRSIEQFVHPGFELEERLLACLCIYNYTSGRGMKNIINLSEGVRESLRRLSNVTWMAEELLKVADYFQPNKWRISCVHSQVLEAGNKQNGGVTALIYYKGLLYSGYTDGSIKAWEIKGHIATIVHETKEHKKAVTCFALYEPGNCLLSGSSDKTIRIWQTLQRKVECIEVIPTKEAVRGLDSWGELIFATTQSHRLKVIDGTRKAKDVFKNKRVKCIRVSNGKVYAGCMDSSIQELMINNNRHQEIKAPSKRWMQNEPISSICMHKDWLYSSSLVVEGSKTKDWRRSTRPQVSIVPDKGANILAMEVVEDFLYLNCSTSLSSIQIWLRGTQHKVGRLSAGSKITSLLTANDMILCGTEKGAIKGWIPL